MAEDTEIDDETALIAKQDQERFDDYIAIAVLLVLTAVAWLGGTREKEGLTAKSAWRVCQSIVGVGDKKFSVGYSFALDDVET